MVILAVRGVPNCFLGLSALKDATFLLCCGKGICGTEATMYPAAVTVSLVPKGSAAQTSVSGLTWRPRAKRVRASSATS
jgi:hypothetical protein